MLMFSSFGETHQKAVGGGWGGLINLTVSRRERAPRGNKGRGDLTDAYICAPLHYYLLWIAREVPIAYYPANRKSSNVV